MRDVSTLFITLENSITDAAQVIDKGACGIALVIDSTGKLQGIVTDVDLRKAILGKVSFDLPVSAIMNSSPIVGYCNESRETLLLRINENAVRQLPIVDTKGMVVGLELLGDLLTPKARPNRAVIMAGGLGERLRPLTEDTPKPMLKVGGTPLLRTIVEALHQSGINRIYVMVRYLSNIIRDYLASLELGIEIICIDESEPLGTCGSLRLLPQDDFTHPFIVMNGDILTNINFGHLLDYHTSLGATATLAAVEQSIKLPYGVVELEGHWVRGLKEKPQIDNYINAGVYVLSPEVLSMVPTGRFDMPELLIEAMQKGHKVGCFPVREFWMDIGQMPDYRKAQDAYRDYFC
jgi:dTDP-glucose pyrophosphorylase